jgi:hypothetical protein
MAARQITIRLSAFSKTDFDQYAAGLGLRASELAKLLIVRERALRRLVKLCAAGEAPRRPHRVQSAGARLPTVTAHMSSLDQVADFDNYARECGLNRNGVGAWLLEEELNEHWLERSLQT